MWQLVVLAIFAAMFIGAVSGLVGTLPVLVLMLFLFAASYSVIDYRLGVMAAVFVLPLAGTAIMPHALFGLKGVNPMNMLVVLTIFSLLISMPFRRQPLIMPRAERPFWHFVALLVFGGLWGALHVSQKSSYTQTSFDSPVGYLRDILLHPLLTIVVAYLLAIVVTNARRPTRFLAMFFFAATTLPLAVIALVAVTGTPLSVLASSTARGFLSRLGMHANEFGLLFNTVLATAIFCLFGKATNGAKTLLLGVIGLLLLGVLLSFSRGAFLGSATVVLFLLFSRRRFRTMGAVICLSVVVAFFMPKAVVERATTNISSGNVSTISAGRVEGIWVPLLSEIPRSPLIGRGMSSILWSDAARRGAIPPFGHPHNAYLGVVLDFGLLGVLVMFVFYRHMWRLYGRLSQQYADSVWSDFFKGAQAGILVLLIQGVTDDRFSPTVSQVFFWLTYGLAIGMSARLTVKVAALAPAGAGSLVAGARQA